MAEWGNGALGGSALLLHSGPHFWAICLSDLGAFVDRPYPRHSSPPIPAIPIWRGFRGKTPSTQILGPRPSALIRGKKFFRSVSSVLISGQTCFPMSAISEMTSISAIPSPSAPRGSSQFIPSRSRPYPAPSPGDHRIRSHSSQFGVDFSNFTRYREKKLHSVSHVLISAVANS
jgi:hypothetical protein